MKKAWEKMTEAEKVEDLRKHVVRIFSALREIASDVGDLRTMVSEVAKKLDSLSNSDRRGRSQSTLAFVLCCGGDFATTSTAWVRARL